ncbi:MAG: EAL domain-containing protein [Campylobacterota bacterium]|nr:EAL domain-containing protein [Campylobacterota bacterium]
MKLDKKDISIYLMIGLTLVLPLLVGLYMQQFATFRFISLPLHSTIESSGAIIAFILSTIIFMMYGKDLELNHFHRASFALIVMGVFDAFHAMVYPGEVFVWLHSLAIFFGGIFFSLVWVPDAKVSKKTYYYIPFSIFLIAIFISVISILYPSLIPQMITQKKEFTDIANLLNIVGGVMYIIASFYFIKKYIEDDQIDNLLFAGHTMLFGSAGVLFFFSSLWDISWWFWHSLRLFAYIISLYFMLRIFYQNMIDLESSNTIVQTSNKNLTKSVKLLQEYRSAIAKGSIISVSDLHGNIKYVNDEFLKITGYTKDELAGKPHNIFRDKDTPKIVFKELWDTITSKQTFKGLIKNRRKDGSSFYAKITIVPILDENGEIFEYLALRDDVTQLVKSQSELKKHFFTDTLTGLNNRFKLIEDLKDHYIPHMAILNIDNFKSINDFYGQEFGDETIKEISNIILELSFQHQYNIYRNHGDEFIITTKSDENFESFVENIKHFINIIRNKSIKVKNIDLIINLTAGMAKTSKSVEQADLALKEAKKSNKSFIIYSDNLDVQQIFENNIQWSKKIKEALDDDRIEIVLQPLYSNKENKIVKYESLVRLIEENGKEISPYYFLDVAKRTKLYPLITKKVFQKTFKALNTIDSNIEVSINICAEDIFDEDTRSYILNLLKQSINSKRVVLELVESEGIESYTQVKEFLDEIKSCGVKLAIDDFGTGYSNFEYLLKLDADFIKIDGSMIKDIDSNINKYNVVETIVDFANKNNMRVIAEYVSSKEIQDKIKNLNIEFSQGYFIDKPKRLSEIV